MLTIEVPGFQTLNLEHLVLDYNGTIAKDGYLLAGVAEKINLLSQQLKVHVITVDTFGFAQKQCEGLTVGFHIIKSEASIYQKDEFITDLGARKTVAIGNGSNDVLMLKQAVLGIGILGPEGASSEVIVSSDLIIGNINDALDLLLNPKRLIATLRR